METSKEKLRVNFDDFWGGQKAEPFYFVKYSTVNCKYLIFLQDFFFRLKPKQYKNANIADCLKSHLETHEK